MSTFWQKTTFGATPFTTTCGIEAWRIVPEGGEPTWPIVVRDVAEATIDHLLKDGQLSAPEAQRLRRELPDEMLADQDALFDRILSVPIGDDVSTEPYSFVLCDCWVHEFVPHGSIVDRRTGLGISGIKTQHDAFDELRIMNEVCSPPLTGEQSVLLFRQIVAAGVCRDPAEIDTRINGFDEEKRAKFKQLRRKHRGGWLRRLFRYLFGR